MRMVSYLPPNKSKANDMPDESRDGLEERSEIWSDLFLCSVRILADRAIV